MTEKSSIPTPVARHKYRGIPEPSVEVEDLYATVVALKEVVEELSGYRGTNGRAITVSNVHDILAPGNILRDDHLKATEPNYPEDPHVQYWHKVKDPIGMSMVMDGPVLVQGGGLIAPWTSFRVDPDEIGAGRTYGVLSFDGSDAQNGVFLMSISMAISGDQKGDYVFHFFVDGVQVGSDFLVKLENQPSVGAISWSHLIRVNGSAVIDFRSTSAPGDFVVESADWSVIRVASADGLDLPPGVRVR